MQTPTDQLCHLAEQALKSQDTLTRGGILQTMKQVISEFFETFEAAPVATRSTKTVTKRMITPKTKGGAASKTKSSSSDSDKKPTWANIHTRTEIGLTSYFPELYQQVVAELNGEEGGSVTSTKKPNYFTILSRMRDELEKPENHQKWQNYHDTIREANPDWGLPEMCPARTKKTSSASPMDKPTSVTNSKKPVASAKPAEIARVNPPSAESEAESDDGADSTGIDDLDTLLSS